MREELRERDEAPRPVSPEAAPPRATTPDEDWSRGGSAHEGNDMVAAGLVLDSGARASLAGSPSRESGALPDETTYSRALARLYLEDARNNYQSDEDYAIVTRAFAEFRRRADWRTLSMTAIAAENASAAEYVAHWEGRCLKAERDAARMREAATRWADAYNVAAGDFATDDDRLTLAARSAELWSVIAELRAETANG